MKFVRLRCYVKIAIHVTSGTVNLCCVCMDKSGMGTTELDARTHTKAVVQVANNTLVNFGGGGVIYVVLIGSWL